MEGIKYVLFFWLLLRGTNAFVYSCNEIKDKRINSDFEESTTYVCLVAQEGYSASAGLKKIYAQNDEVSTSFFDMAKANLCVERPGTGSWRIVADLPISLDCTMELTLIFTSSLAKLNQAGYCNYCTSSAEYDAEHSEHVFVVPQTGIAILLTGYNGIEYLKPSQTGNITVYTGAGTGASENRYFMASWRFTDAPSWIKAFDNVITIVCEECAPDVSFQVSCYVHNPNYYEILSSVDYAVVMMSGNSDNAQILYPERNVAIFTASGGNGHVSATAKVSSTFQSPEDSVSVQFKDVCAGGSGKTQWFNNASSAISAYTDYVTVSYTTDGTQELWDSSDNFIVEITITDGAPPCGTAKTTTTKAPVSTTAPLQLSTATTQAILTSTIPTSSVTSTITSVMDITPSAPTIPTTTSGSSTLTTAFTIAALAMTILL